MSNDLKTVYTTSSLHVAHMLQQILQDYGISSSVPRTTGVDTPFEDLAVLVHADELPLATRIASAFDKHILNKQGEEETEDDDEFYFWLEWPTCPKCKSPRQTKCQFCQTAGTDFVLADAPPMLVDADSKDAIPEEDLEYDLMLMCHTCDEPFEPVFYRHCQWCEHEFSDGFAPELEPTDSEWTKRTIAVVVALVAVVVATMIYVSLVY